MKKIITVLSFILAVAVLPCSSQAAGSSLEVVLYDAVVGAGIGALAGAATMAFMDHPGDHYERIAQGASIGVLCGIAFGFYEIRPILYSYKDRSGHEQRVYGLQVSLPLK
jgi:hypothetical protein